VGNLSAQSHVAYRNRATYRGYYPGGKLQYRSHVPYRSEYTYRGYAPLSPEATGPGGGQASRKRVEIWGKRKPQERRDAALESLLKDTYDAILGIKKPVAAGLQKNQTAKAAAVIYQAFAVDDEDEDEYIITLIS